MDHMRVWDVLKRRRICVIESQWKEEKDGDCIEREIGLSAALIWRTAVNPLCNVKSVCLATIEDWNHLIPSRT